jgi:protoporphyrinogen oxidase
MRTRHEVWLDIEGNDRMTQRNAIIIGAGPAGLTAAYELLRRTDVIPVVYEAADVFGGLSRTVDYRGNKIDIGGHRFFSKSSRVVDWWLDILPLQGGISQDGSMPTTGPDPEKADAVMLWRKRQSRILYGGRLFDYPISPSMGTLWKLGPARACRIVSSYLLAKARPIRTETSLEDFLINRFGRELFATFFKDYTEKLWGVPCSQISPTWGAQRIKGLSLSKTLVDAARRLLKVSPAHTETSLIKHFMYPKLGPGQLWTQVARTVEAEGGRVRLRHTVVGLTCEANRIAGVRVRDDTTGQVKDVEGDFVFSSMPVKDLIGAMTPPAPVAVREIADGLVYRDFITVGLLLRQIHAPRRGKERTRDSLGGDCWIYVQEPHVKVGRIQIFNNWSPYLVRDKNTVWVGLEYFCNEGDELWSMTDAQLRDRAAEEMVAMGFITRTDVLDGTVLRIPKAYPAYFGTYDRFDVVRRYTDAFENLFLIGRNGMHQYNNSDHSMLSAMTAVDHIVRGVTSKKEIWSVNPEGEYHETVSRPSQDKRAQAARPCPGAHEIHTFSKGRTAAPKKDDFSVRAQ